MPLDPRIWLVPPYLRRFPPEAVDHYESENTPLNEIFELWEWKNDLADASPMGPKPNRRKVAEQLGREVEDFLGIEAEYQAALEQAESERRELLGLSDAATQDEEEQKS